MSTLRKDPLTQGWVIYLDECPLPAKGTTFASVEPSSAAHCPYCPGHEIQSPPEVAAIRMGTGAGFKNSPNWQVRAIPNSSAMFRIEGKFDKRGEGPYDLMNGIGAHEVIVESPRHEHRLADYSATHLADIWRLCRDRSRDLLQDKRFRYIQVFRNFTEWDNTPTSHPNTQVVALPILPRIVREELINSHEYFLVKERCVFCDMIAEDRKGGRIVFENDHFVSVAPFASKFPGETWIYPKEHNSSLTSLTDESLLYLGEAVLWVINAFTTVTGSPPRYYVVHSAPTQPEKQYHTRVAPVNEHFHWHIEIIPKTTKAAGFEYGTGLFVNALTPEIAAQRMREAGAAEGRANAGLR